MHPVRYWLGKHHSEETKQKIREATIKQLARGHPMKGKHGKPWTKEQRAKHIAASKGHLVSKETRIKIGKANGGKNNGMFGVRGGIHPSWKGGRKLSILRTCLKRRGLGFEELNQEFDGSEAHHIDGTHVIFIPRELHRSVWHSQNKPETMNRINTKVFCWLLGRQAIPKTLKEQAR